MCDSNITLKHIIKQINYNNSNSSIKTQEELNKNKYYNFLFLDLRKYLNFKGDFFHYINHKDKLDDDLTNLFSCLYSLRHTEINLSKNVKLEDLEFYFKRYHYDIYITNIIETSFSILNNKNIISFEEIKKIEESYETLEEIKNKYNLKKKK